MHDWPVSVVPAIPTAVHHESIEWHHFSDPRFNGPWTADEWCTASDNLDHLGLVECDTALSFIFNQCDFLEKLPTIAD